jgi:hypothetical protein
MVPAPFIVVLDANVLFPFTLRDTLLRAAAVGFYEVRWSSQILDEMIRNLVGTGTMPEDKGARLRDHDGARVSGGRGDGLRAPGRRDAMVNDEKDRHVTALAPVLNRSREQAHRELRPRDPEMIGDVPEDPREGAHPKRVVQRHGDVVLTRLSRGEPEVAPCLASDGVADPLQRLRELLPGEVARQPHAAMISSRTK